MTRESRTACRGKQTGLRAYARASLHTLLALVLLGVAPTTARAHGSLKSATPAADAMLTVVPRELRLVFTEVPALAFSRVELRSASGAAVPLSPLRIAADSRRALVAGVRGTLTSGTYTVVWQMAGDDGHPVRGRYTFTVAAGALAATSAPAPASLPASLPASPDASAPGTAVSDSAAQPTTHHDPASMQEGATFGAESPAYVAIRALLYLGMLMAIGAVAFHGAELRVLLRRRENDDQRDRAGAEPAGLPSVGRRRRAGVHAGYIHTTTTPISAAGNRDA